MDKHAPIRKMCIKGNSSPWYNAELGEMRKNQINLKKKINYLNIDQCEIFIIIKLEPHRMNILKRKWRKCKLEKKYGILLTRSHNLDIKNQKLVKSDGTVISEFDKIADELASEFVFENVEGVKEEILTEINDYEKDYENKSSDFLTVEIAVSEITKAISKVKKCKNVPNTVPKRIIKNLMMQQACHLVYCLILF